MVSAGAVSFSSAAPSRWLSSKSSIGGSSECKLVCHGGDFQSCHTQEEEETSEPNGWGATHKCVTVSKRERASATRESKSEVGWCGQYITAVQERPPYLELLEADLAILVRIKVRHDVLLANIRGRRHQARG